MKLLLIVAIFAITAGCATIITKKADLDSAPEGVRLYPQMACLLIDKEKGETTVAYFPDKARAYDVKPLTVFAKQEFKIESEDGQLKNLTANQDTTAFLTFLKEAAALAAKAAGAGVSANAIKGSFGQNSGVYCFDDKNQLRSVPVH
jgi:hypothetical protein